MTDIFSFIRRDKEFVHSVEAIGEQLKAKSPLPIAVNGLQGGAIFAYVAEAVREARRLSGAPVLVLVRDEQARIKMAAALSKSGITALASITACAI